MKRIALFAIMAAFILGSVATASAIEIKASGDWRVHANWTDNITSVGNSVPFDNGKNNVNRTPEDDFNVYQRARIWFNFIANENLKAVLGLEIGDITWGNAGGGQLGADGTNIETKHAYLDFNIPGTAINLKAGIQPIALPSNLGSTILDDDMAALVMSAPITENISIVEGYARLYNKDGAKSAIYTGGSNYRANDEVDAVFLVVPLKYNGWSLDPFGMVAMIGKDSVTGIALGQTSEQVNAYWFGFRGDVTAFDPITVLFDFNYGMYDDKDSANDRNGYYFDLAVDYKMAMMTPEVFFFYASGYDKTSKSSQKSQMIGVSPAFGPTTTVFDGSALDAGTGLDDTYAQGLMGIGLKLKDITFVEKLSHTLTIAYLIGTNDKSQADVTDPKALLKGTPTMNSLTTKDTAWEVDFDTTYQMYENLSAILEIGYVNLNLDKNLRGLNSDDYMSDAWKIRTGFRYKF